MRQGIYLRLENGKEKNLESCLRFVGLERFQVANL